MSQNLDEFAGNSAADADQARIDAEDCGRLIEVARTEKGWSRTHLAETAGVPETEVIAFEEGRTSPVEPMLSTLLQAMGHI
ncbi:hypothetical protein EV191_1011125 [Tamaricihabitans halophyticus]|uniref:Helix-turn-helix protein n=1 Tax=Tamaricihabitans halophyticus TaxID=1262583 RepID=A0A4R2R309_9PSEU|nr:helix-turn-helix transcriptional regulator [Tamaricihabitans halophyticus]TCP57172.1 hypothetical protein EV191_1011125 [Tamaricihabitans halophyticus]